MKMNRSSAVTASLGLVAAVSQLPKPADAADYEKLIIRGREFPVESVTTTESLSALKAKAEFCAVWPKAKIALAIMASDQLLKGPWGSVYRDIIPILIAIGDAACS